MSGSPPPLRKSQHSEWPQGLAGSAVLVVDWMPFFPSSPGGTCMWQLGLGSGAFVGAVLGWLLAGVLVDPPPLRERHSCAHELLP